MEHVIYVDPIEGDYTMGVVLDTSSVGEAVREVTIFCQDAIHEIMEPISFSGYKFTPDKASRMIFKVDAKRGYIFTSGAGKVITLKGEEIVLTDKKKNTVFGKPSGPNAVDKDKKR